jgi:O-methyltransferase involved in polyketide biosynthesis
VAVRQTFEFLAQAGAGSQMAFTYVLKDLVEGRELYGLEKPYQRSVVKDQVWHFGFAPEEVVCIVAAPFQHRTIP